MAFPGEEKVNAPFLLRSQIFQGAKAMSCSSDVPRFQDFKEGFPRKVRVPKNSGVCRCASFLPALESSVSRFQPISTDLGSGFSKFAKGIALPKERCHQSSKKNKVTLLKRMFSSAKVAVDRNSKDCVAANARNEAPTHQIFRMPS